MLYGCTTFSQMETELKVCTSVILTACCLAVMQMMGTHTHLFVYGFSMPLSSTVMEHLHILYIVPGVICWFSSSLCANSFKNAKLDSLLAALPEAKQQCYPHTNVAADKVRCAINVNPHHFFPPTVSLASVLPLSQSLTV